MAQGAPEAPGLGAPHAAPGLALPIPAAWKIPWERQDGTPEANPEGLLAAL